MTKTGENQPVTITVNGHIANNDNTNSSSNNSKNNNTSVNKHINNTISNNISNSANTTSKNNKNTNNKGRNNNRNVNSNSNNSNNDSNLLLPRRHNSVGSSNRTNNSNNNDCPVNIESFKNCIHPPESTSSSSSSRSSISSSITSSDSNCKKREDGDGGDSDKTGSPPDGGWGWVVVLSSFVISLLVDGVCFSQGIFFPEFRREFGSDASTTSWVGSVLNGTYMCVGPLVSVMCHVWGCRRVAAGGAVVAAASLCLATAAPSIPVFVLTYGFLAGCGFGMMYLPAIVMVGYYFSRRRALATGIACCGSGIGGFLFAPLGNWLIGEVGWRGATYVLAGLVLSALFFALFYRPLEKGSSRSKANSDLGEEESEVFLDTNTDDCKKTNLDEEFNLKTSEWPTAKEYHGFPSPEHVQVVRLARSQGFDSDDFSSSDESLAPLQRKDIFYSGNIAKIPEYNQVARRTSSSRDPTQSQSRWVAALTAMFDVTLLRSPTFIVYGTSCFLCMMGFFVPFTYMPTHAIEVGISGTDAAFLISIIGITNIVGRVAVGYVSDLPWADCLLINNCALALGGLVTGLVPHMGDYWMFAAYSAVFGLAIAVFVSLRSIIMVELMGLHRLTAAFGFVIMCQGASSLIGSPIAGAISDYSGTYTYSFYMAGASLFLSGLICFPLRRIARWEGLTTSTDNDVTP